MTLKSNLTLKEFMHYISVEPLMLSLTTTLLLRWLRAWRS